MFTLYIGWLGSGGFEKSVSLAITVQVADINTAVCSSPEDQELLKYYIRDYGREPCEWASVVLHTDTLLTAPRDPEESLRSFCSRPLFGVVMLSNQSALRKLLPASPKLQFPYASPW